MSTSSQDNNKIGLINKLSSISQCTRMDSRTIQYFRLTLNMILGSIKKNSRCETLLLAAANDLNISKKIFMTWVNGQSQGKKATPNDIDSWFSQNNITEENIQHCLKTMFPDYSNFNFDLKPNPNVEELKGQSGGGVGIGFLVSLLGMLGVIWQQTDKASTAVGTKAGEVVDTIFDISLNMMLVGRFGDLSEAQLAIDSAKIDLTNAKKLVYDSRTSTIVTLTNLNVNPSIVETLEVVDQIYYNIQGSININTAAQGDEARYQIPLQLFQSKQYKKFVDSHKALSDYNNSISKKKTINKAEAIDVLNVMKTSSSGEGTSNIEPGLVLEIQDDPIFLIKQLNEGDELLGLEIADVANRGRFDRTKAYKVYNDCVLLTEVEERMTKLGTEFYQSSDALLSTIQTLAEEALAASNNNMHALFSSIILQLTIHFTGAVTIMYIASIGM